MKFLPFGKKQMTVLSWWANNSPYKNYDAIICDGAVRSGKTLCTSVSFVLWAMKNFNGVSFAFAGKTVSSLKRNVITPLLPVLRDIGISCQMKETKNYLDVGLSGRKNRFYLFGGKDESSASLIQGITLGGVLLDEVALMPRSFVEQAIARCSLEGSKLWFNCNPENPYHWFYREWILKAKEKNALYLHFVMRDNPSLKASVIKRYESTYSGAFFERFIEGKWVAAEGLVYPFFDGSYVVPAPDGCNQFYLSCDYGTVNPFSLGLWGEQGGKWYRIKEYYYSSKREGGQKTDEEYYDEMKRFIGGRPIKAIVVDPSAASFIELIKRRGEYTVRKAVNDVVGGIREVCDALKSRRINICVGCDDAIREFSLYRWDENSSSDKPIKENDHALDDIRYFVATVLCAPTDDFFVLSSKRKQEDL